MDRVILLDTGPLVAYLKNQDDWHDWTKNELAQISSPLLSCEAVIVEACFLLRNTYQGEDKVISLLKTKQIILPFRLDEEANYIQKLMGQYKSVPMSLADACLVRMAELYNNSSVFTLDSDFKIYRKNRNQAIPLIIPTSI